MGNVLLLNFRESQSLTHGENVACISKLMTLLCTTSGVSSQADSDYWWGVEARSLIYLMTTPPLASGYWAPQQIGISLWCLPSLAHPFGFSPDPSFWVRSLARDGDLEVFKDERRVQILSVPYSENTCLEKRPCKGGHTHCIHLISSGRFFPG